MSHPGNRGILIIQDLTLDPTCNGKKLFLKSTIKFNPWFSPIHALGNYNGNLFSQKVKI